MRGKKLSQSLNSSKNTSMVSLISSTPYHERIEQNNKIEVNNNNNSFLELFYETLQEKEILLNKVTKTQNNTNSPHTKFNMNMPPSYDSGNHPISTLSQGSTSHNNENAFINIHLLYDLNAPTDSEIWNRRFHPISLHGSIKHIVSDTKNIKDFLKYIAKYISNKQLELSKINDLNNFDGISNIVWNFISSIYESNWDALFTDNKSNTIRRKIAAKFTSKIQSAPQKPSKESTKSILTSIERILLLIPAKS